MHKTVKKKFDSKEKVTLPEVVLPTVLPTDAASLVALLHSVVASHKRANEMAHHHLLQTHKRLDDAQNRIDYLLEQILLGRRRMFGASSEQSDVQGYLFNEAEALALGSTEEQDVAVIPAAQDSVTLKTPADLKAPRGKRASLPAELKRVEVLHDVPESERTCPCGTTMVVIGQDVSEQLDIVPMQIRVLRHVRMRYGCPDSTHPPGKPVVIFDYDPSRSAEVPVRLLHDYRGYLMADGYAGYNKLARTEGIERMACWAHVRRRFVEASRVQPKGKRGLANEAIGLIGVLYGIERDFKKATDQERFLARQERSVPALAAIYAWMQRALPQVTPKSALGTALSYMRDQWSMLIRYPERGDLPIDNNRCENAIRPFVLGRKAWLFSDTVAGAKASAVIYSLIETAKANGLEPYHWLRQVLRELPGAKTVEAIEALLPWNVKAKQLTTQAQQESVGLSATV